MRKIVCIYPEDKSTNFLLPIYKQLEHLSGFVGYRFDTLGSHETKSLYNSTNFEKGSLLFFLGHGASNKLYGSVDENGNKQVLFNADNIAHIKNLDFVGIACRSREFANNRIHRYIGFGDITSDFSEIETGRNLGDPNYMDWASEDDIIHFQHAFTTAIVNAIKLSQCMDLLSLYKMLKLCINKQISELLIQKELSNYRSIADMLFEVLSDMEFCMSKSNI